MILRVPFFWSQPDRLIKTAAEPSKSGARVSKSKEAFEAKKLAIL